MQQTQINVDFNLQYSCFFYCVRVCVCKNIPLTAL